MIWLLLIVVLSIPVPPFSPLSYSVTESINDSSIGGRYNVTYSPSSSGYHIVEYRNVGDEGHNSTYVTGKRFGPGTLRYPLLFFDPSERLNALWWLVNRITKEWNGTRGNTSISIEHKSLYLSGEKYSVTYLRLSASRDNGTSTLEVIYVLLDSLGVTYLLRYKVLGSYHYYLALTLKWPQSEKKGILLGWSVITLTLGFVLTVTSARLMIRKHRRRIE